MVTFLCHRTQQNILRTFLFVICHMGVICIDRITTAVDKMQVAIKYIFDLAVCNVRGQIVSIFFKGVHTFKPHFFSKADRNC